MPRPAASSASTLMWALPLLVMAAAAAFYGADSPQASLTLSAILLLIGAFAAMAAPRRPNAATLLALAAFAGLLGLARLNGWLATGAPEYASLAACGAVMYTAAAGAASTRRARSLWHLTLYLGGALAILAFLDFANDPATNFGRERPYALGRLSAPFLSANTAATFYGVITIMALAEVARAVRRAQSADIREWIDMLLRGLSVPLIILMFSLSNVILTASRAGAAALALAALVYLLWEMLADGRNGFALRSWITGLFMALLIGGGVYLLSGDALFSRLAGVGEDGSRWVLIEAYWQAVWLEPVFGHGLGGFSAVNALAGTPQTNDFLLDQGAAHNLYLQWMLQTGFAGFGVAALLMLFGLAKLLTGLARRRGNKDRIRAVLCILLLIGTHGLVDYAMEIPLFAWLAAWMMGLGLGMAQARGAAS